MRMTESNIVYEREGYWVYRGTFGQRKPAYTVFAPHQNVASIADSMYPHTNDGKSLAIARANYLSRAIICSRCNVILRVGSMPPAKGLCPHCKS